MSRDSQPESDKGRKLSSTDYTRLYEYRLGARKQDLRKAGRSRRTNRRKGSWGYKDPTALSAIRRVMYSSSSEGW